MRERERGEERDTTTQFIKIQIFTHASCVTKFSTERSCMLPCTMWHVAGLMSRSHVERELVVRIKMEPEHEKVVACIPSVGRVTKVSKTPKRVRGLYLP